MARVASKDVEQPSRSAADNEATNLNTKLSTSCQEGGQHNEQIDGGATLQLPLVTKEQEENITKVMDPHGHYAKARASLGQASGTDKSRGLGAVNKDLSQIARPASRSSSISPPPFSPGLGSRRKSPLQFSASDQLKPIYEAQFNQMAEVQGGMMDPPSRNTSQRCSAPSFFPREDNYTDHRRSPSLSVSLPRCVTASQMLGRRRQQSPYHQGEGASRPRRNLPSPQLDDMDVDYSQEGEDENDDDYLPQLPKLQRSQKSRGRGRASATRAPRGGYSSFANYENDDNGSVSTSLFVSKERGMAAESIRPYRISKSRRGSSNAREKSPRYTHDSYLSLENMRSRHTTRRPSPESSRQPSPENSFQNIGLSLEESRYSGSPMPWGVNKDPAMTYADEISEASLAKRGLKLGQGDKVCKRGYGANDPENISIVNMKEKDKMGFQAIADELNKRRVSEGKPPTLSFCGIAGRYNRTAPLLFASEGKIFVPLSERRSEEGRLRHGRSVNSPVTSPEGSAVSKAPRMRNEDWNAGHDMVLVKAYKAYDADRWHALAQIFTEQTGINVTAEQMALRHSIL